MKSSSGFYGLHASAPPGPGCRRLVTLEYQVLTDLAANAGRVLTNEHLVQQVRGAVGDVRPIRTALSKRRRRLGDDLDNPTYFFTEPRVGCRMARGGNEKRRRECSVCDLRDFITPFREYITLTPR